MNYYMYTRSQRLTLNCELIIGSMDNIHIANYSISKKLKERETNEDKEFNR